MGSCGCPGAPWAICPSLQAPQASPAQPENPAPWLSNLGGGDPGAHELHEQILGAGLSVVRPRQGRLARAGGVGAVLSHQGRGDSPRGFLPPRPSRESQAARLPPSHVQSWPGAQQLTLVAMEMRPQRPLVQGPSPSRPRFSQQLADPARGGGTQRGAQPTEMPRPRPPRLHLPPTRGPRGQTGGAAWPVALWTERRPVHRRVRVRFLSRAWASVELGMELPGLADSTGGGGVGGGGEPTSGL